MAETPEDWNHAIIEEFRAGGGTTRIFGSDLVLLHHTGAKTGAARVSPLVAQHPDADTWLLSASASGADRNPAWYHNLRAHPDVQIEVPGEGTLDVRADELTGAAREAGWARFVAYNARYSGYQQKTSRVIPVIALHRR